MSKTASHWALVFGLCGVVAGAQQKSNIFFLLTDDQDLVLGGLDPMPQVQKVIHCIMMISTDLMHIQMI